MQLILWGNKKQKSNDLNFEWQSPDLKLIFDERLSSKIDRFAKKTKLLRDSYDFPHKWKHCGKTVSENEPEMQSAHIIPLLQVANFSSSFFIIRRAGQGFSKWNLYSVRVWLNLSLFVAQLRAFAQFAKRFNTFACSCRQSHFHLAKRELVKSRVEDGGS